MMNSIMALCVTGVLSSAHASVPKPFQVESKEIPVPASIAVVLNKFDPRFRIWRKKDFAGSVLKNFKGDDRNQPSMVLLDLNGDGVEDAIFFGHNDQHSKIVALISKDTSYEAIEISKMDLIEPRQSFIKTDHGKEFGLLTYIKPAPLKSNRHAGFEIATFGKRTIRFYFENGKFAKLRAND